VTLTPHPLLVRFLLYRLCFFTFVINYWMGFVPFFYLTRRIWTRTKALIVKFIDGFMSGRNSEWRRKGDCGEGGRGVQTDCKVKGYIGLQIKSARNKLFHQPNNVNSSNNMTLSSYFLHFLVLLSMFLLYWIFDLTVLGHY